MNGSDSAAFQERYGGRYVALSDDDEVVASADTYDELSDILDAMDADWSTFVIEYVEPVDTISVY